MLMHQLPHHGEVLCDMCLHTLGLTVTDAAKALDVSRRTLRAILNRKAGISPEMATRLSIAFNTSAEGWLIQHIQYELGQAEKHCEKL